MKGIIRTKAVLDRESQSHYWLTVYAQDNAAVPLHSIVEVYIQVSDVNDNAPFPTLPVFRGYIPENSAAGTDIIRVEVEDLDETESQNITFEIPSKKIRRMFQIDRTTDAFSASSSTPLETARTFFSVSKDDPLSLRWFSPVET
ncbi:putative protocadherin Fat 1 [Apostichopus japonicus]|uniref:Putative protocadherin Fat 1 n=1 Tax=Stichopus japonicus TaxID=307972 RepID=A0A2G8JMS9_STIJA|nr:putative protocadherin Fat 1 [Apostichopus japonicus]